MPYRVVLTNSTTSREGIPDWFSEEEIERRQEGAGWGNWDRYNVIMIKEQDDVIERVAIGWILKSAYRIASHQDQDGSSFSWHRGLCIRAAL